MHVGWYELFFSFSSVACFCSFIDFISKYLSHDYKFSFSTLQLGFSVYLVLFISLYFSVLFVIVLKVFSNSIHKLPN